MISPANKPAVIRAVARKNGVLKELVFTPETARERGVAHDIISAYHWVKETGFKHVKPITRDELVSTLAPAALATKSFTITAGPVRVTFIKE